MKKFLVIRRAGWLRPNRPEAEYEFDTPGDVAIFMWGKDLREYNIFVRADNLSSNIDNMRGQLVDAKLDCTFDL